MRHSIQRWECPIHNSTIQTWLYLINNMENIGVFLLLKDFDSDNSCMFVWSRNAQVTFLVKPQLLLRVPLWIGHCYLCMKGRLKLHLSPFMEYCLRMLFNIFVIFRFWRRYTHTSPLLWIVGLTGTGIGYSPLAEIIYWSYSISGSFSILPISPYIKYREAFPYPPSPPPLNFGKLFHSPHSSPLFDIR